MDVSVIIVNYHTADLIADCLNSVVEKTEGLQYEVIIVDNNSQPDLKDIIKTKTGMTEGEDLHYIPLKENIGFGRANNEGLKVARGRNVFFLNPDTILLNNAIKILSDFLDQNKEAGACGGNLFGEDLKEAHSFRRFLPGIRWEINELLNNFPQKIVYGNNYNFNHTGRVIETGFVTGADLMVKREVLAKVGGFSPLFFMYYEETDLCARIWKRGWKIYNVPSAHIQHLEGKSFDKGEKWQWDLKNVMMEKNRRIYYKRNKGALARGLSELIYMIFLGSRVLMVRNPAKKKYYKTRLRMGFKPDNP